MTALITNRSISNRAIRDRNLPDRNIRRDFFGFYP
jgi:hypothetical protein